MTTPRRSHRALLVLTASPADDANGNDPWSVFTTEGWTVDITCIGGGSPGPRIPGAPLRAPQLEQLGTPDQLGLDGSDDDCTGSGRADRDRGDRDWADRDWADRDWADRDWADRDWADRDWADRDCADYDVVCFVAGHTTTWVSPRNPDLSRLVSRISEHREIIAVVR